jgi:hypothetical protein
MAVAGNHNAIMNGHGELRGGLWSVDEVIE